MNKLQEYLSRPLHPEDFSTWEEYSRAYWKQFWIGIIYEVSVSGLIVIVGGLIVIKIIAVLFIK